MLEAVKKFETGEHILGLADSKAAISVVQVIEGGIRQTIKEWRKEARYAEGFGKG